MLEAAREESSLGKRIVLSEHTFFGFASWIVVYIPRAVSLVNSTISYVTMTSAHKPTYNQDSLSKHFNGC